MLRRIQLRGLITLLLSLFLLSACEPWQDQKLKIRKPVADNASEEVIYGDDNRKDLYEVSNNLYLHLARSTVALVSQSDLIPSNQGDWYDHPLLSFKDSYGLCPSEPFNSQNSLAFCSGTLIAPNQILTAGHCITSQSSCDDTKFVFDFAIHNQGQHPRGSHKDDVYQCTRILHRALDSFGPDFAIVEIDRPVTDRFPVHLGKRNQVQAGSPLVVIGHPSGIPTKVADGARIRTMTGKGFFVANLDTYGGNSGSGVFDSVSGDLVGVLVRGETDFVYDRNQGCTRSNKCAENSCRGEDVTDLDPILGALGL